MENQILLNDLNCQNNKYDDLAIAWRDLTFKTSVWFKEKTLLHNLTGRVNFGEVTALMGPSGAGKTTLLKCLYGMNRSGLSSNSLFVSKKQRLEPCFIVQEHTEHLMMRLTVRESLVYASMLKNSGISGVDHQENAKKVLEELLLSKCADNSVADCSGGEQKRLAIGLELTALTKPNLMCFDEPTTGLDSDAAERLMVTLQEVASNYHIAVVISIHQPNADILNLTDHLYVLSVSGHCVFDGRPEEVKQHLIDCEIPDHDWRVPIQGLLKAATKTLPFPDKTMRLSPEIVRLHAKTRQKQENLEDEILNNSQPLTGNLKPISRRFSLSDFYHLVCRNGKNHLTREWKFQLFLAGVIFAGCFSLLVIFPSDAGTDGACPPDIINSQNLDEITGKLFKSINGHRTKSDLNVSFLFLFCLFYSFSQLTTFSIVIPKQIKTFLNEHRNGWYSTSSFFLALNIIQLPMLLLITYLYVWISYFGTSQLGMTSFLQGIWQLPQHFQLVMLFYVMAILAMQGTTILTSIIFHKDIFLSMISMICFISSYMLYTDFILPIHELGFFEQMMGLLSLLNLLYRSLIIILYGEDRCDDNESLVLAFFRSEEDKLWLYFELIIWQIIVWRIFGYFALWFQANDVWDQIKMKFLKSKQVKSMVSQSKEVDLKEEVSVNEVHFKMEAENQTKACQISMALVWKNLEIIKKRKIILKNLTGIINFGEITALMGPSGAGKTTLLKTINGMNHSSLSQRSKIYVRKSESIRQCFVVQDTKKHLFMSMTVKESLCYSSLLKNREEKNFDHKQNVQNIAEELLLTGCINNVIANCSGGEQKRLAIGQELTVKDKPNLICVDEPTSGLDSCNAEVTIKCLKKLAINNQIAIVTSIHQPDQNVLEMFDSLYVLSGDGRCIFFGEPNQIKDHLQESGVECKDWQVPIDQMIKVASPKKTDEDSQTIDRLTNSARQQLKFIDDQDKNDWVLHLGFFKANNRSFNLKDFFILLSRQSKRTWVREWGFQLLQFLAVITAIGVLIYIYPNDIGQDSGCVQPEIDLKNISAINDRILDAIVGREQRYLQNIKFLYIFLTWSLSLFTIIYVYKINIDLQIFINEHRNGWYSSGSFFWSRDIVEVPFYLVSIYLFCLIGYFGTSQADMDYFYQGFWDIPQRFLLFFGFMLLTIFNQFGFFALCFTIFYKSFTMSLVFLCAILTIQIWLSGVFIPVSRLHPLIQLINASQNSIRYSLEALVIVLFKGRCPSKPIIFNVFEISEDILLTNFLWLVFYAIVYRLLALLIIRLRVDPKVSQIRLAVVNKIQCKL